MGAMGSEVDLENRDPSDINDHLQVMWKDVFGEPQGIKSPDKVWELSYKCFRGTKNCCYKFLTAIFAPCIAFCFGCHFACLAFQHIWCVGPCLRSFKVSCGACRQFMEIVCGSICAPCYQTMGLLFSQVRIKHQKVIEQNADANVYV